MVCIAIGLYATDNIPQASDLRRKRPFLFYVVCFVNLLILYSTAKSMVFLSYVVLGPLLGWIVHAAIRSRGIKNKVCNTVELVTGGQFYANTPMGFVLVLLGLEARDYEE